MGRGSWLCLPPGGKEVKLRPATIQTWVGSGTGKEPRPAWPPPSGRPLHLASTSLSLFSPSSPSLFSSLSLHLFPSVHSSTPPPRNPPEHPLSVLLPLYIRKPTAQPFKEHHNCLRRKPPDLELENRRQSLAPAWDPPLIPEPQQAAQQVEPFFSKQTLAPLPWALVDI